MSQIKELSLKAFKENLNIYFSKDNGEDVAKDTIDEFSKMAVQHNKENNPFFYSELLSSIKVRKITLSELTVLDGKIVNELFHEAAKQATIHQNEILGTQNNRDNVINENNEVVEKILKEEDVKRLLRKEKVDETIEKYGGIKEFLHNATEEEFEEFVESQKEQKTIDEVDELFARKVHDKNYQYDENQKRILANTKKAKKLDYDEKTGEFDKNKFLDYMEQKRALIKNLEAQVKVSGNNLRLEGLEKSGAYDLVFDLTDKKEIKELYTQIQADYELKSKMVKLKSAPKNNINFTTKDNIRVNKFENFTKPDYQEEYNIPLSVSDVEIITDNNIETISTSDIEDFLNIEFDEMDDFYQELDEVQKNGENIDAQEPEIVEESEVEIDSTEQLQVDEDELLSQVSEKEEIQEQVETFEHKTGFEKLLDKMKDSKNPVTKFLFNRITAFQNRNNKRLESSHKEIIPGESKEKIDPVVKGNPRINAFFDKILGRTTHKEPENTIKGVNPNNEENKLWAVSDDVKAKVDAVSGDAAKKASDSKIIIPKEKNTQDKGNNEGPSFDDNL